MLTVRKPVGSLQSSGRLERGAFHSNGLDAHAVIKKRKTKMKRRVSLADLLNAGADDTQLSEAERSERARRIIKERSERRKMRQQRRSEKRRSRRERSVTYMMGDQESEVPLKLNAADYVN